MIPPRRPTSELYDCLTSESPTNKRSRARVHHALALNYANLQSESTRQAYSQGANAPLTEALDSKAVVAYFLGNRSESVLLYGAMALDVTQRPCVSSSSVQGLIDLPGVAQCSGARPVTDADWFVCLHEAHGTQLPALSHQAEWWQCR